MNAAKYYFFILRITFNEIGLDARVCNEKEKSFSQKKSNICKNIFREKIRELRTKIFAFFCIFSRNVSFAANPSRHTPEPLKLIFI